MMPLDADKWRKPLEVLQHPFLTAAPQKLWRQKQQEKNGLPVVLCCNASGGRHRAVCGINAWRYKSPCAFRSFTTHTWLCKRTAQVHTELLKILPLIKMLVSIQTEQQHFQLLIPSIRRSTLTVDTKVLISILFQIFISPSASWQGGGHGSPAANFSVPECHPDGHF